jgi:hypothetical protein
MNFLYKNKYLKYKQKYINLKNKLGGATFPPADTFLPYTRTINYNEQKLTLRMMKGSDLANILKRDSMKYHDHGETSGVRFARSVLSRSISGRNPCKHECLENNILFGVALYLGELEEADFDSTDPYLYVTLQVNPALRLAFPMGVQRNFEYNIKISRSSFILHTFWASFVKTKFPNVKYCMVSPTGAMTHLFLKYLKFDNDEWIPIAINFLGDMELFLDNSNEYFNIIKDEYRFQIISRIESNEVRLERLQIKLPNDIEKANKIYKDALIDLKEDKEDGSIDDEKYNKELEKEKNDHLKKIKILEDNLEFTKRDLEEDQETLNSDDKLKESVKKSISNSVNFFKIKKMRLDTNGLLMPNPIDVRESQNKVTVTFSDSDKEDFVYKSFWNQIPTPTGKGRLTTNSIIITIKIDDLNTRWDQYSN